jgi:hypothetical protein
LNDRPILNMANFVPIMQWKYNIWTS